MSLLCTLALCAILALSVFQVNGFCIYNNVEMSEAHKRETRYWIRQQPYNAGPNYFSRFAAYELKAGEKSCCSYTNTDCVRSGSPDDEIYIVARRTTGDTEFPPMVISLPAGGSIEFAGGEGPETQVLNVYNADGSPYDYKYRIDHQAGYTRRRRR